MKISRSLIISVAIIVVITLSMPGLLTRWELESANRNSAIVADYMDIRNLAIVEDLNEADVISKLYDAGVKAIMIPEYTGTDLARGIPDFRYGPASVFCEEINDLCESRGTVIAFERDQSFSSFVEDFLASRYPDGDAKIAGNLTLFNINKTVMELEETGILPDPIALYEITKSPVRMIYRPGPSGALPASNIVDSLQVVSNYFGPPDSLAPSGEIVAGYPDLKTIAEWGKKLSLPVAKVEFSRQVGEVSLNWSFYPFILSMHSVTPEEILSRRISSEKLFERMIRASRERSVRLLVMRPSWIDSTKTPIDDFISEISRLESRLKDNGISNTWPQSYEAHGKKIAGALALALILILSLYGYFSRIWPKISALRFLPLILVFLWIIAGFSIFGVSLAAKIAGAMAAAFIATEASLIALEGWKTPLRSVVRGFLFAIAGGLAIASFFGTTLYMTRLMAFSGVKLTLLLPPLLLLFHDLKRRIHPESLSSILNREPLWGEIFLLAVAGLGAGIVLFRSGNVQIVPGWEIALRDNLERLLVARPRSKELFVGYPFLFLWYLFARKDIWIRYREIFRLGTTLAFSSVVNSFCHFHTRLGFILLREFNGLWTGIIAGLVAVALFNYVFFPFWRRYRGVLMD